MMRGELGDVVIYACHGQHNSPAGSCEAGDPHAAIVVEVLNRDANGAPHMVVLAILIANQAIQFTQAAHADRTPGEGDEVFRIWRGMPPAEMVATPPADARRGAFALTLDYPLGSWHGRDE